MEPLFVFGEGNSPVLNVLRSYAPRCPGEKLGPSADIKQSWTQYRSPDLGFDSLINQFPTCQTIFSLCPHNHSLP